MSFPEFFEALDHNTLAEISANLSSVDLKNLKFAFPQTRISKEGLIKQRQKEISSPFPATVKNLISLFLFEQNEYPYLFYNLKSDQIGNLSFDVDYRMIDRIFPTIMSESDRFVTNYKISNSGRRITINNGYAWIRYLTIKKDYRRGVLIDNSFIWYLHDAGKLNEFIKANRESLSMIRSYFLSNNQTMIIDERLFFKIAKRLPMENKRLLLADIQKFCINTESVFDNLIDRISGRSGRPEFYSDFIQKLIKVLITATKKKYL